MRVFMVYESMFGNTQKIAQAVADGLTPYAQVELVEVGDAAGFPDDVDLVVVGGPTHAFGLSRPDSRRSAAKQATDPVVSRRIGLREWLAAFHPPRRLAAAVFDTRVHKPVWLAGSAARGAAKRLRRAGCTLIATPESFFVTGTTGPLSDGELERAGRWGASLGAQLGSGTTQGAPGRQ